MPTVVEVAHDFASGIVERRKSLIEHPDGPADRGASLGEIDLLARVRRDPIGLP